jgi:type II secretory ATPase GspE/PulE/Tfp pilus assembly ATPase PilB-like protein
VLRLLNPKTYRLDALGLRKDLLSLLKKEIKKPNGMIIVTGPTGSGKTTTLYAFSSSFTAPASKSSPLKILLNIIWTEFPRPKSLPQKDIPLPQD